MVLFGIGCFYISFGFTPSSLTLSYHFHILNLTPLIPLSNQQDRTSPVDKYIGEGEKYREGAEPPLPYTPLSSQ